VASIVDMAGAREFTDGQASFKDFFHSTPGVTA
jgi:hypothetical protein